MVKVKRSARYIVPYDDWQQVKRRWLITFGEAIAVCQK